MVPDHALLNVGEMTSSPSTADSTEMAGVMTRRRRTDRCQNAHHQQPLAQHRLAFDRLEASASMATVPPSPWLSARSTSVTYLSETTTVSVQ